MTVALSCSECVHRITSSSYIARTPKDSVVGAYTDAKTKHLQASVTPNGENDEKADCRPYARTPMRERRRVGNFPNHHTPWTQHEVHPSETQTHKTRTEYKGTGRPKEYHEWRL